METQVQTRGQAHRHRRVRHLDRRQRRPVVQVLVAVVAAPRDPPGDRARVVVEPELGQLVRDVDRALVARLRRHLVAEAETVVERAHTQVEAALRAFGRLEPHDQLVVVIAHVAPLAPRLLPGVVVRAGAARGDAEAAIERGLGAEAEAERAGRHRLHAGVTHRELRHAPFADVDRDDDAAVRGAHVRRMGRRAECDQEHAGGAPGGADHRSVPPTGADAAQNRRGRRRVAVESSRTRPARRARGASTANVFSACPARRPMLHWPGYVGE